MRPPRLVGRRCPARAFSAERLLGTIPPVHAFCHSWSATIHGSPRGAAAFGPEHSTISMTRSFSCQHGHAWRADDTLAADTATLCPQCGAAGQIATDPTLSL